MAGGGALRDGSSTVGLSHRRRLALPRWQFALPALPVVAFAALVFGGVELYVQLSDIKPQVLPAPTRVLREGWEVRDILWTNTRVTLQEVAIGMAVAVGLATLFAVLIDFSAVARRTIYPTLVAMQTLPIPAIAPLLIIWFGFELTPKIIVIAMFTLFPMAVAWVDGFASTEKDAMDLLRSMGASRRQLFMKVRLPQALPSFFSGLRISVTYVVVVAIFAEFAGAIDGLGIYIVLQQNSFRTDLVMAAVLVTAALTITLFASTFLLQRLAIPWYFASRRANG